MGVSNRHWRLVLGSATAALAIALVAGAVAVVSPAPRPYRAGPAYPRIQQAAGIIDLMRAADPRLRPAVLRALDGTTLVVTVAAAAPPVTAALRRAPRIEDKLREFAAPDLEDGLRAYTDAAIPARETDTEGRPARITWPLPGGGVLVMGFLEHGRPEAVRPAVPPYLPLAAVAVSVAAAALWLGRRGSRAVLRLAQATDRFDGAPTQGPLERTGDADMDRLALGLRRMQERVAGLLQERSFLIGAISHDLKTYLTRLRLRAEGLPEADQRERMAGDLEAMSDLIDTSLAFARGTTTSQHKSLVDLSDLVAIEAAERIALGQAVEAAAFEEDAPVIGDPVALRRVLANLVDNALKFGRGRVVVMLEDGGPCYRLLVDDDGPGIGPTERAAIFSPFYRVEGSRNRRTGGSGLGLAIARQIVEAHGGTIVAEASPLGGARLVCGLPKTGQDPRARKDARPWQDARAPRVAAPTDRS